MTKSSIIYFLLTIALSVYLVISVTASNRMATEAQCSGVFYNMSDSSAFVNSGDIDRELGYLSKKAKTMNMRELSLLDIEKRLSKLSVIENARCYRLTNDAIRIDLQPMVPVARVFESDRTYYINREGKELTANARYQIDVPVIYGSFKRTKPVSLVPLIDEINKNPERGELITAIKVQRNGDIILIPSIVGHVINFGDTKTIDDKFKRLMTFYRDVMPVKGWDYYDTISVKFAGQVIGKIAGKYNQPPVFEYANEDYVEELDAESMTVDSADFRILKPKIN